MKDKTQYIKIAKEIIRCYLDKKGAITEIGLLLNDEIDGKYTYLKEYIITIKNIMNESLKEMERLESKNGS